MYDLHFGLGSVSALKCFVRCYCFDCRKRCCVFVATKRFCSIYFDIMYYFISRFFFSQQYVPWMHIIENWIVSNGNVCTLHTNQIHFVEKERRNGTELVRIMMKLNGSEALILDIRRIEAFIVIPNDSTFICNNVTNFKRVWIIESKSHSRNLFIRNPNAIEHSSVRMKINHPPFSFVRSIEIGIIRIFSSHLSVL